MSRNIQITVPSTVSDKLVADVQQLEGVVGLQLQRNVSLKPPGDVLSVNITTSSLQSLMHVLDQHKIGRLSNNSFSSSELTSLVSASQTEALTHDGNESAWEEMEMVSVRESHMSPNMLCMMLISGFVAAIGIGTNALHLVIGAMVLAPGFIPLTRLSMGLVNGSRAFGRGLLDTLKGYTALMIGAALGTLFFMAREENPLVGESSYLPSGVLTSYWTEITAAGVLVSVAGSIAGALLVATNRSILSAGVMIALALVPAATISTMSMLYGDVQMLLQSLQRLGLEIAIVVLVSAVVYWLKLKMVHKRKLVL